MNRQQKSAKTDSLLYCGMVTGRKSNHTKEPWQYRIFTPWSFILAHKEGIGHPTSQKPFSEKPYDLV